MSAVAFENYSPGRLDGWRTSLLLHGVLGGLILFAAGAEKPSLPEPFRWDVALLSSAPSAPMVQAQPPELPPVSRPSRVVAPKPVVTRRVAPAVTEAIAPVQQQAAVSAAPATPVMEQAKPNEPPELPAVQAQPLEPPPVSRPSRVIAPKPVVTRQAAPDAPTVTEAVAPVQQQTVVSAAPAAPVMEQAEPNEPEAPPPSAVADTGWLADLLWRRMEALKRYPYLARRNGWEGQVLIKAVIGADGRLLHTEIQQSSGYEVLDQDALKVLRASTPLELEQTPSWQQVTLTIPVAYRLQR